MALYRAAELARDAGYPFVQVLKGTTWMSYSTEGKRMNVHGLGAEMKVRGSHGLKDQAPCEMKDRTVCPYFGTDFVLRQLITQFAAERGTAAVPRR